MFFANRFKKVENLEKETNKTIELKNILIILYTDNSDKIIVDYIINYNSLKKISNMLKRKLI